MAAVFTLNFIPEEVLLLLIEEDRLLSLLLSTLSINDSALLLALDSREELEYVILGFLQDQEKKYIFFECWENILLHSQNLSISCLYIDMDKSFIISIIL